MLIIDVDTLLSIFIQIDDFCKDFDTALIKHLLPNASSSRKITRKPSLSNSEIMTILILFHYTRIKDFKRFYLIASQCLKSYFRFPSYNRFIELIPRVLLHFNAYINHYQSQKFINEKKFYIDSKKISVCKNQRIKQHKVFKGIAERGKTSMGWFYGLKLFLLVTKDGEVVRCMIVKGNVADNNDKIVEKMLKGISGKIYGDKGFIINRELWEKLFMEGKELITKIKKNMKNKLMGEEDKYYLRKRGLIESVLNVMSYTCNIEHSRHRSVVNAIVQIMSGVCAYTFFETKCKIRSEMLSLPCVA